MTTPKEVFPKLAGEAVRSVTESKSFLERHGKKLLWGTLAVGLGLGVAGYAVSRMGETVFDEEVHGAHVKYEEGIFHPSFSSGFTQNRLTIETGPIKVVMTDYEDETSIDELTRDNLFSNNLEEIAAYEDGELKEVIKRGEYKGFYQEIEFKGSNSMYNVMRFGIKLGKERGIGGIVLDPEILGLPDPEGEKIPY